ncbi:MAG TPA: hypothetical protein EYN66_12420 [Myxococcales bacterium]|nr:hypothetical protein [Myxococcales bacterium]
MTEKQQPTELDSVARLGLVAVAATDYLHPSTSKTLIEACDAVEADFDALQAKYDRIFELLRTLRYATSPGRGDEYDALQAKHALLQAKYDALLTLAQDLLEEKAPTTGPTS